MSSFQELVQSTIADGKVDADEAAVLRTALYDDGVIDREEADALFSINDAVSGQDNDPAWSALFVEAISDHVLKDDISPGVVDADEGEYLKAKIHGDGKVDDVEKALLANLKANATGDIPGGLGFLFEMYL